MRCSSYYFGSAKLGRTCRFKNMQLSYYEKVRAKIINISQDTSIWNKYSVKYTQYPIKVFYSFPDTIYTEVILNYVCIYR